MHPCAVDHCRHVAEVVPVLEIPFVGRDFAAHVPLRISVPLAHCKRHAREAIPSDFLERSALRVEAERVALDKHFLADWRRTRIRWLRITVHEDHSLRAAGGAIRGGVNGRKI